jgi:hypothetical protein
MRMCTLIIRKNIFAVQKQCEKVLLNLFILWRNNEIFKSLVVKSFFPQLMWLLDLSLSADFRSWLFPLNIGLFLWWY